MPLEARMNEELKAAMRAKDQVRLDTIRAVRGEILKLQKSGSDKPVTDEDVTRIIKSQIKQRQDAILSFQQGHRDDLIAKEQAQMAVLQGFLPAQLTAEELGALVAEAIAEAGAKSPKDMGAVMKALMPKIRATGKDADNRAVSELVKSRLAAGA